MVKAIQKGWRSAREMRPGYVLVNSLALTGVVGAAARYIEGVQQMLHVLGLVAGGGDPDEQVAVRVQQEQAFAGCPTRSGDDRAHYLGDVRT